MSWYGRSSDYERTGHDELRYYPFSRPHQQGYDLSKMVLSQTVKCLSATYSVTGQNQVPPWTIWQFVQNPTSLSGHVPEYPVLTSIVDKLLPGSRCSVAIWTLTTRFVKSHARSLIKSPMCVPIPMTSRSAISRRHQGEVDSFIAVQTLANAENWHVTRLQLGGVICNFAAPFNVISHMSAERTYQSPSHAS